MNAPAWKQAFFPPQWGKGPLHISNLGRGQGSPQGRTQNRASKGPSALGQLCGLGRPVPVSEPVFTSLGHKED